jgi:RHS repeat-associated protein
VRFSYARCHADWLEKLLGEALKSVAEPHTPSVRHGAVVQWHLTNRVTFTGQRNDSYLDILAMGARWYSARTARWLSADTIIPHPANPQGLNRYTYVYNRPHRYIDDDGHTPLIVTALVGAVIGFVADVAIQAAPRIRSGLTVKQAVEQTDWGRATGSAVAGGITGLTLGLAAPATVGAAAGWGALGGLAGGRAAALAEAAYDEAGAMLDGAGINGSRFLDTAIDCGLIDPTTVAVDIAGGAFSAAWGKSASKLAGLVFNIPETAPRAPAIRVITSYNPKSGYVGFHLVGRPGLLMMEIGKLEQLMIYLQEGSYEAMSSFFEEMVEEGAATWVDDRLPTGGTQD